MTERQMVEVTSLGHTFRVLDPNTYPYGDYEFRDELFLKELHWSNIEPGETIVDVGASWGGWSLPALAQGARILAFEPAQHSLDVLRAAIRENGWDDRAETFHALLGDGQPMSTWFREEIFKSFRIDASKMLRLDDVLQGKQVTRIKCDVEGMELQVLRGALGTLMTWMPLLLIEDHTNPHPDRAMEHINRDVCQLLRDVGYKDVETVQPPTGNQFILAGHK